MGQTNISQGSNSNIITLSGVTYFGVHSPYIGDNTKNCGLTNVEVDNNFLFLRGYDIASMEMDSTGTLTLKRVNQAEPDLQVSLGDLKDRPEFKLSGGTLYITYSDGEVVEVDGFAVGSGVTSVAHDCSLIGDGTMENPLGLCPNAKTGQYAPCESLIDLTNGGNIPECSCGAKPVRYVTKEKLDVFGALYNYDDVMEIKAALEADGSKWRIPAKTDWDNLLNAFERAENRNHSGMTTNGVYGKYAGRALKSVGVYDPDTQEGDGDWRYFPGNKVEGVNVSGLAVEPVGYYDAGGSYNGFRLEGIMWTSTDVPGGDNVFAKSFRYDECGVKQISVSRGQRASVRLVRDFDGSTTCFEDILGQSRPVTLVRGLRDDYPYAQLWTSFNLSYNRGSLPVEGEYEERFRTIYCVADFDGKTWRRTMMKEGDSVVLKYPENKEYRIVDGVLVDVEKLIADRSGLSAVSETLISMERDIESLGNILSAETSARISGDNTLDNKLSQLSGATVSFSASTVSGFNSAFTAINKISASTVNLFNDVVSAITVASMSAVSMANIYTNQAIESASTICESKTASAKTEAIASAKAYTDSAVASVTSASVRFNLESTDIKITSQDTGKTLSVNVDNLTVGKESGETSAVTRLVTLLKLRKLNETTYALVNKNNEQIGDQIVVTTGDTSSVRVQNVYFGQLGDACDPNTGAITQDTTTEKAICFKLRNEDGSYELLKIGLSSYLTEENVFGKGIKTVGGIIQVGELPNSEEYLTIGDDGIGIFGVDDAISNAYNSAVTTFNEALQPIQSGLSEVQALIQNLPAERIVYMDGEVETRLNDMLDVIIGRIAALTERVATIEETFESAVKDIINRHVVGVEREIEAYVVEGDAQNDQKLAIGFAENAVFGYELDHPYHS